MNPDDYDEDGNNIVPCPICLNVYCPGNQFDRNGNKVGDGKCPEEDEYKKALDKNMNQICDNLTKSSKPIYTMTQDTPEPVRRMVEKVAKKIYDAFPYNGTASFNSVTKPAWVPNGNSIMQDTARRVARDIISTLYNDAVREGERRAYDKVQGSKLVELLTYWFPRAVGHTWTEVHGVANNPNALLLVADRAQMQSTGLPEHQQVSIAEVPVKLRGRHAPIVIDHYALQILVDDVLRAITPDSYGAPTQPKE